MNLDMLKEVGDILDGQVKKRRGSRRSGSRIQRRRADIPPQQRFCRPRARNTCARRHYLQDIFHDKADNCGGCHDTLR